MGRWIKRLSITGLLTLFVLSALARIVSAGLGAMPEGTEADPLEEVLLCPPSDEVATLLGQIAGRDEELRGRETALAMREQDLEIARQEIESSLERLGEAESRLAARMEMSATASNDDINRLVAVYEGMKPKDAAVLFEAMEPTFASGFLARMRPDAASALFSNLSPEKAYALSVMMAGRNANAATE
ncbi:hypothetical protein [uncultured Jannaschia sp.]|uniref:MotE family protein n=1 Tax=uncultured Jannaschia sp. TaxID=293347 RepID=UPI002619B1F9|nr:hypothetical protein [uncultured Jannaschia sp.]